MMKMIYTKIRHLLLVSPIMFAFSCHARYEEPVSKLQGRAWVQVKNCMDDSCQAVTDTFFYYYFPPGPKTPVNNKDTISVPLDICEKKQEGNTKPVKVMHYSLHFPDSASSKGPKIYPIILRYGNTEQSGSISFVSDSEFILIRHIPKGSLPSYDKDVDATTYFRLANTPRYISDITNK